jgi:hypothetical protein
MYNFANEYALREEDRPLREFFDQPAPPTAWANHFPLRMFTYAPRRTIPPTPFYLYCRSRYRGSELRTKVRVDRTEDGGFRMRWVEDDFRPGPSW